MTVIFSIILVVGLKLLKAFALQKSLQLSAMVLLAQKK
jgi:hypothetical protein